MHSLRHTLASALLEKNTPLSIISDILGHVSADSTTVYLKLHFPSEHTQHHHLISPLQPTGSLIKEHLCIVTLWTSRYFRTVVHLSCRPCFTLSHSGLPIRLRVSRFSASPSDSTSQ
ncbi:tyrosine-type recombinase/integrase [Bacillus sp. DJP31]|uniref:tyrosine-type recombinase/integrase n=1 Tax=Bacillus sp. DJP31 TaxID=3409789 RepID=UPI003BB65A5F